VIAMAVGRDNSTGRSTSEQPREPPESPPRGSAGYRAARSSKRTGIGGTGLPLPSARSTGIGGTGLPLPSARSTGIGGTGLPLPSDQRLSVFTEGVLTAKPTGVSIVNAKATRTATDVNLFIDGTSWNGSLAIKAGGSAQSGEDFQKAEQERRWNP
jgi:hypothetical protein